MMIYRSLMLLFVYMLSLGCTEQGGEPMKTVPHVDIDRFMGDWYVVASIPTFVEKTAHNPVESYQRTPDGTIATTFTFNKGHFDGPLKVYKPTGFILDEETNARWGMQFIWPWKADYRIIYLDEDYQMTIVGRAKRDHVWVMSRTPDLADHDFEKAKAFIESVGYDPSKLQRVPHQA